MKKQTGKKLSLKKIQITQLNVIKGGYAYGGGDDTMTGGDTTSEKCPPKPISGVPPIVIAGDDGAGNNG